jgi:hypothetical protein
MPIGCHEHISTKQTTPRVHQHQQAGSSNINKCCSPDLAFCRRLVWIFLSVDIYLILRLPSNFLFHRITCTVFPGSCSDRSRRRSFPAAAACLPPAANLGTQREPLARWPQTATDATRNSPCRRRFTLVLARRIARARPRKRPSSAPARHPKAAQAKAAIHRALSTSLTSSRML